MRRGGIELRSAFVGVDPFGVCEGVLCDELAERGSKFPGPA